MSEPENQAVTPPPLPATPPPLPATPPTGPKKPPLAERVAARREAATGKLSPKPPPLDPKDITPSAPRLRELDAEIESELEAAMAGMSDKDLYAEPAKPQGRTGKPGEPKPPLKGKVIAIHNADVFIEVPGGRSQGVLSMTQFPDAPPKIGDLVEFQVERYDPSNGLLILTREGAAVVVNWSSVHVGQVVEARVTQTNKGGLSVEVNGIRGFLPISQIDLYRVENAEQFVNQRLLCLIAEVDPAEKNLVVSRRALLEREREEKAAKLWVELAEGQIRQGTIRSIKPFGAFVDLGGVDGLIPISELSYKRVGDPSEVVSLGQSVQVYVVRLDRDARRVSLSLRKLLANPWDELGLKYPPGSRVTGPVTKLLEFGALVELEPGIEGLIHISQLAPQRVFRVCDIVQVGQTVEVVVLDIDKERQRISLSLKQALAKPSAAPAEPEPDADEPVEPTRPPKPRTTPLRGGIGDGPLFPDVQ